MDTNIKIADLKDERFSRAILVETIDQYYYLVNPIDDHIGRELRFAGQSNNYLIKLIKNLSDPTYNLLNVGAHIGTVAIPVSRFFNSVVAIEANPDTYNLLAKNILLNGITNCRLFNFAAFDKFGTIEFLKNTKNTGGSKIKPVVSQDMYYYDNPEIVTVETRSIDNEFGSEIFDIILMDIEGAEYYALKGMTQTLSKAQALFIEFLPHHLKFVGGITIKQFYEQVASFDIMFVPSLNKKVYKPEIYEFLEKMYVNNTGEDFLIFVRD